MKVCNNCGFENPDGIHICLRCASSFEKICTNCGSSVPAENSFCGKCGARIEGVVAEKSSKSYNLSVNDFKDHILKNMRALMPTSLADKIAQGSYEISGIRREATVLLVDLASVPGDTARIDSEMLFLANDKIMQFLAEVVYKYEGTIDKYSSDGMMALFGIPLNHENDPERAVRAAHEMQQIMTRQRQGLKGLYGFDLRLRISVNTGSVITGVMNNQNHLEYNVVGNTITLASQLKDLAAPGQVLVSFNTYQRTNPILNYKRIEMPIHAGEVGDEAVPFELLGLRVNPGQMRGLPGGTRPMIGRVGDIEKLKDALHQVAESKASQVILCSGEPGIGKSRLIAEFQPALSEVQFQFFQGTCAVYMRITPYRVIANLLRNILNISEMDPDQVQTAALQHSIAACELDPGEITASLLHVLGLPQIDPLMAVRFRFLEPSMLQKETFLSLRMFLLAISRRSPVVLAFDDLHWVDKVSAQFLDYFTRSLDRAPILLVLIGRNFNGSEEIVSIHSAANKRAHKPVQIHLEPLSLADTRLLLDQYIPENTPQAMSLKSELTERAGGNPYFVEELVRLLIDKQGLVLNDGQWNLLPNSNLLLKQVPGTLQDIILSRLDQLNDSLRSLIQKASVLNNFFSINLLRILSPEGFESLRINLDQLVEREFLIRAHFGNEDGYLFKHPLLQSTVYQTLLKRNLREYHFAIAEAIESGAFWLSGEKNEILAHHYAESRQPERSIPYLIASAEKAAQHYANETAADYYQQALSFVEKYTPRESAKLNKIRIGLGRALKFKGDFVQATRVLEIVLQSLTDTSDSVSVPAILIEGVTEMADLRAREGNLDQAAQLLHKGLDLIGDNGRNSSPTLWRRLIERLAWVHFRQGNLDEAHNLADLALMGVTTLDTEDPVTFASLYNTLGGIYWSHIRYSEAVESVERSLSIHRSLGYHWGIAAALNNLGVLYFSMSKWTESLDCLEQADKLQNDYGFDPERPINLKNIGEVLIALGDYAAARRKLTIGLDLSRRFGIDLAQVYLELGLSRLSFLEENVAEAVDHLDKVKQLIGSPVEVSDRNADYYILLSQILVHEKKFELAVEAAEKALTISQNGDFSNEKVDALRILGSARSANGMFEQAETDLYELIQASQRDGDRYGESRGLYEIAKMFWAWSKKDSTMRNDYLRQAESSLDRAIRIFETLGAKRNLLHAQTLRAQIRSTDYTAEPLSHGNELQTELAKFRSQTGLPAGEWYQSVILYTLLVPGGEESDELVFETINYLMPFLITVAEENGGKVIREHNGFMVIFGAPAAHEDDSERAADSAIQMINLYSEIYRQTQLPVSIQIGLSLGKIIAGQPGAAREHEWVAAGEPIQLARKLAELAGSARALVSAPIRNITSHRYEYVPASTHVMERVGSQPAYQLEGLREQILPVRGLIGLKTPFVGRDKEYQAILALSTRLDHGTGGLVWLEGEPGIGKSRLLHELSSWASAEGKTAWIGECTNRRADVPFSLFSGILAHEFDIHPNYSHSQIYNQIDQRLENWPVDLMDTRPYLEFLLGVQPREGFSERLLALEPEQLRRQIFVALHRIVTRLANIQPLVMFLDDLQWIDAISADLLLYLSYLIGNHRILIICAHRANEVGLSNATLTQVRKMYPDHSLQINLEPLSVETCYTLLEEFLAAAKLTDAVKSLIVNQSGGNPYYLEEFVRMLVEQDYLHLVHGRLEANQVLELNQLNIPNSLETLIRARVDALPVSARQLIQIAAIMGRPFTRDLIQKIAERDDVNPYLELLQTRGMLSLDPGSMFWQLCHPIIELVVYNTVLHAQRKLLHAKIGLSLESYYQGIESDHVEELAYHFGKSVDHTKALKYLILAGERAALRYATEAAISYFTQASDLLSVVPDGNDELRWRIAVGLGETNLFAGNYTTSLASLQAGIDLAKSPALSAAQQAGIFRRLGDTSDKLGEHETAIDYLYKALEILGDPTHALAQEEAARIYARLGWSLFHLGSLETAKEMELHAVTFGRASNNLGALAAAENYLGGIFLRLGDMPQAVQHTREAMTCWEEIGYSWGVANTLNNLGILEVSQGNMQAALTNFEASLSLRRDMGDVEGLAIAYNNLGQLLRDQGELAQAEGHFRNSLLLTRSLPMIFHTATTFIGLSQVLIYLGRIEEAGEQLNHGRALAQGLNAPDLLADLLWTEAELKLARADFSQAELLAQQVVTITTDAGYDLMLSAALRIIAQCQMHNGDLASPLQILDQAQHAAESGAGELELGRVNAQKMRFYQQLGDQENADKYFKEARETFVKLDARRDLLLLETRE